MAARVRLRPGFRVRVLGFSAALLAAAAVVGLVVQRAVLLERLDREVAASLRQERRELESLAGGRDPATGERFAGDAQAVFDTFLDRNVALEGEVYLTFLAGEPYQSTPAPVRLDQDPELVDRWASLSRAERGHLDTEAGPVEYLAVPLRDEGETVGVFVVANFVRGEREEIEAGIRIEALVAGVVLVVAMGAAWVIAGRLLRPVRELTESARSITETDLSRRIPVQGDDEIAELARTFNEMLDRLDGAFTAQRAFVDDAGHELRTPITIVRGHLELMEDDPEDRERTLGLVTDELDRMSRIVDDLLLLAKAEQPDFVQPEPVELSDLTTELLVKARALGDRDWHLDASAEGLIARRPAAPDPGGAQPGPQRRRAHRAGRRDRPGQRPSQRRGALLGARRRPRHRPGRTRAHLRALRPRPGPSPTLGGCRARAPDRPGRRRGPRRPGRGRQRARCGGHLHPRPARRGPPRRCRVGPVRRRAGRPREALTPMARILIAEDEARIASFLEKGLRANGFTTLIVADGPTAASAARDADFDLVILDLGLPRQDGLEVLAEIRRRGDRLPVIVLTAREAVPDRVAGLEGGADDYVTKPFSFEELLARIRVRLRDSGTDETTLLREGSVTLDLRTRRATVDGRSVELTSREYALLEVLLRHPDQVLSREQILSHVWGYDFDPGSNIVEVYVRYLRKKLGDDVIETVRGMGYRLTG